MSTSPDPGRPSAPGRGVSRALALVPARLGSVRLARKMLLRETGRYLFEHTARNVIASGAFEAVVVATDSDEVLAAAEEVGLRALATDPGHASGTDRCHEALELLRAEGEAPFDVVVNVQGDEPELPADDLTRLVAAFAAPEVELATLATSIESAAEARDPAIVKVVLDSRGDALYFSRAAIPYERDPIEPDASWRGLRRHVGVYGFRPAALARFCALGPSPLEQREALEQLRWLEHGGRIRVLSAGPIRPGIDTREHYEAFVRRTAPNPLEESRTR